MHLGSVNSESGTVWFTLVIEDSFDYYVERYNDSQYPFVKERFKRIEPEEFGKHQINGVSLTRLIGEKMKEIISDTHPLRFKLRPLIRDLSPDERA